MKLSEIQKEIVEAKEKYIVVNSCAGSGKTRTLTERVKYLLANNIPAEKIVVITFTNAAAAEMLERIGEVYGLICCTIHSYANRLLTSVGIDTSKFLNEENFDKLFSLVKNNPHCVQEVEYLLLDEGQDSTEQQFEFMLDIVHPKNWMIFSDHRQSMYGFAGATPDYILDLMKDPSITVYNLTENYRNAPEILDFAKALIRPLGYEYKDNSVPMYTKVRGRVVDVDYSPDGIAKTIRRYAEQGKSNYSDWFVLTRTNAQLAEIQTYLENYDIPCDTFKKAQLDNKGLKDKMNENTVKVLTIHTAKGLEAKNVVVIGARWNDVEERCINYVAATRAKELLVWTTKKTKYARKKKTNFGPRTTNWE